MKNEVVWLVNVQSTRDEDGFNVETEKRFKVWADVESAKRSEYYAANAVGVNVQYVITVNFADYEKSYVDKKRPTRVQYDGVMYKIIRTYRIKKNNDIELTLAEVE